jgi:hypothetical protein
MFLEPSRGPLQIATMISEGCFQKFFDRKSEPCILTSIKKFFTDSKKFWTKSVKNTKKVQSFEETTNFLTFSEVILSNLAENSCWM